MLDTLTLDFIEDLLDELIDDIREICPDMECSNCPFSEMDCNKYHQG